MTFRRNILSPSSGSKNKRSNTLLHGVKDMDLGIGRRVRFSEFQRRLFRRTHDDSEERSASFFRAEEQS
jgi:hypothetical protein